MESTLKVENFWAEMRSTTYLFAKSAWPSREQQARLALELEDILGKRILSYPQTFADFGIGAETPYKLKKQFLGLGKNYNNSETSEADRRFMKFMATKAAQAQKANWTWRIAEEAEQKQLQGWYPFFVTLTIDPKKCNGKETILTDGTVLPAYDSPEQLWKKGREFRKYIRRLANIVAAELGHPPPHKKTKDFGYRAESDYVTYAGVIEHGKSMEHHHAHIMVWMKEIPSLWKIDPNTSKVRKDERECKPLRNEWPWAIESQKPALYFRTKGDIWSRLGHVVPIEKESEKPIKINSVKAVGNYVTKYMQKGNKIWHHRMKCTRNLGMTRLIKMINKLEINQLEALSWKPEKSNHHHLVSLTHSVPQGIVRLIAKRKIFSIRWESRQLGLMELMKANYGHYKKMLKSVRDGARPDRMPSAELYDWVQQFLPEIKDYSKHRLIEAHKLLSKEFPKQKYRVKPIVFGGNQIGFTQCI